MNIRIHVTGLLAYSAVVTSLLFYWQVLGSASLGAPPLATPPPATTVTSLVGLLITANPTLWRDEFLFHVIILGFTALQMPQYASGYTFYMGI